MLTKIKYSVVVVVLWAAYSTVPILNEAAFSKEVRLTVLHTNDIHSRFRGEKTLPALGGVARIKTVVKDIRAKSPNVLFLDGGDWAEGSIYYTEGTGREALKMMDHLTYDAAVVGNHDWLNGPDVLLQSIREAKPSVALVSANLSSDAYANGREFRQLVRPYVIRQIDGAKVAIMGLSTYEFIYDKYFEPVKVQEPFGTARELASRLKNDRENPVDFVIAISHNNIGVNKAILKAAPNIDLIIGAHDHVKLTEPVVVNHLGGHKAWIVETGCWGQFLGRVDVTLRPDAPGGMAKRSELVNYKLIQIDTTITEDKETLKIIETLERRVEKNFGPIFHDHMGESHIEISQHGSHGAEHLLGSLATDAYLGATDADLSLDAVKFIYGELHKGPISTVDVFNANPAIYNPTSGKAWTLKTLLMKGSKLNTFLSILYSSQKLPELGLLNTSGMQVTYEPIFFRGAHAAFGNPVDFHRFADRPRTLAILREVLIRGRPLEKSNEYKIAASEGVIEALRFLNAWIPGEPFPLDSLHDTGIESWRIMASYIAAHSPITLDKIPTGRIRTFSADLGILYDEVTWQPIKKIPGGYSARVKVNVRNFGASSYNLDGAKLRLLANENGLDYTVQPHYREIGGAKAVSNLAFGEAQRFEWEAIVPRERGICTVTARIDGGKGDYNRPNDEVTHWFACGE